MSRDGFVHLRCRSAYSLLEGAMKVKAIKALALEHEAPAVGLTDTNNLFGALEFSTDLAAAGVQPVIGLTLSVRAAPPVLGATRCEPDGAIALLAQTEEGYARLMQLTSAAFLDVEPADAPHVAIERVLSDTSGLIALTGGPDGVVNRWIGEGREEEAADLIARLAEAFPDRLYVELQRHDRDEERRAESVLVAEAYTRGLPLLATNEPYFAATDQYQAHDALLAISESSYVEVEDRRRVTPLHHFATPAEMAERFADLPEAVANTMDVARRCAFKVPERKPILPSYDTSEGRDEAAELAAQAREGLKARLAVEPMAAEESAYFDRLDHELKVITDMGFPGYFLIVADFIKWAKAHDIPVGPGRGSGAGSIVAWALTITNLDPLRYGLLFERFLNPERVSMPDFDIDFCQERRGEVIEYVQDKYGEDRVAQIITFGTLQARAVLRDVGRVMQLPFGMVDRLAKMVPSNPANPVTLKEAIDGEPRLQSARESDADVRRLLAVSLRLEGLMRNASTHAAGVVIGDRPLTELVPLYRDPRSDLPATQFNMSWVERAGLVKFDFLGLKTLTVIDRALKFLARDGTDLDIDTVPLDDPAIYELLAGGGTVGVFQLEGKGMTETLRKMKADRIGDIIAAVSLYRPGPMKNIDTYVNRKHGVEEPDYLHPSIEPILKETYGVIIYQEQVMQIAQVLSGYSLGEADLLRRAMGKKKPEEMAKQKDRFLHGAEENDVPKAKAAEIFDLVAEFAGYGFNKSHAAAYAYVAGQTAYLKAHHPVEFLAASMSLDIANTDKLGVFVQEAKRIGVSVLPPDVNASMADFDVQDGSVRYALGAVRNVGLTAMEAVVEARQEGGLFKDLHDFAARIDPRAVNKRAIENLARAGAFDSLGVDRARACAAAEKVMAMATGAAADRNSDQASLFGGGNDAAPLSRPDWPQTEPWTAHERLDEEFAALGLYLSGHPLDESAEALRRRNVIFASELEARAEEGRDYAKVAGVVRRRQERVSAKSGERFAFLTLSDPTGEFEALVPPELLVRAREIMETGAAIIGAARLSIRDGETRLFLDEVSPLEAGLAGAYASMRVVISDREALATVKAQLERLAEKSGGDRGQVSLVAPCGEGREVELALPGLWPVDAAARAAIKGAPGVAAVEDHAR